MDLVTCPREAAQTQQTSQVVVEHGLKLLEPLKLGSPFVIVEPARKQHEGSHDECANGSCIELRGVGDTRGTPQLEETGGDLDAVETTAYITVEDLLTNDGPNNLCTGLDASGVGQPSLVVRKASAMEVHAAQPDKDTG